MRSALAAVLDAGGGFAELAELRQAVALRSIRRAVCRGELIRVAPRVYAASGAVPDIVRAIVSSSGGALSHGNALASWDLLEPPEQTHVMIDGARRVRSRVGVVVHRATPMPVTVIRSGVAVVNLDRSLVDTWSLGAPPQVRGAMIAAVRRRLTTPLRIWTALGSRRAIKGAAELGHLLDLLERGCQSELEIWGLQRVLIIPGIPRATHQILVQHNGRRAYLDAGWEAVKLGVEFDGARYHGGAGERERDVRRDAWLAAQGWLILRFSYQRLVTDPESVRNEIRAAYEIRIFQLGLR